ncbi:MAG: tRNA (adenosine(37)-N6)-dimethylallyltransferase MiaA [Lentisphaeria bacterium]|nr:tRNA (adenosine(37)-N6)-dimethylallyltransferase MiaA [Lentisphaeria bacterium]
MSKEQTIIPILVVLGPTASGKTSFAVKLAEHFGGEIISADSRQLYRGMDIGSGKDITEYTLSDGRRIPCHLVDIVEPSYEYNLAEFMRDCHAAIKKIHENGNRVILAGGTALYLDSILRSYRLEGGAPSPEERKSLRELSAEELRKRLALLEPDSEILKNEPENLNRISRRIEILEKAPDQKLLAETRGDENIRYKFFVTGVFRHRDEIRKRIEIRLDERLENGMLDEERYLHEEKKVSFERLEFFGLEYKYMALYLQNKLSYGEMRSELLCRIRQFAKRQDSWFRYIERRGIPIYWFTPEKDWEKVIALGEKFFAGEELPPPEKRLSDIFYGKVTSPGK